MKIETCKYLVYLPQTAVSMIHGFTNTWVLLRFWYV